MNDSDELVRSLDPRRDYGERSYDEIVAEVRTGRLPLEPGRSSLPVIRDPATNRPVKGTGQPRVPDDQELARWGRRRFNERAAADFDAVYEALLEAAKRGDVGEVGDPEPMGTGARKSRSTRSAGLGALSSDTVVRFAFPRTTPESPSSPIRRSTVQRATGTPSRCSCRHILRAP
jgi:hypothetical protein